MPKHLQIRKIKIHQSYDVIEVSILLGVSKQTVRKWILEGLPVLNAQRPKLILGFEIKAFLEARQSKRKQPLQGAQFMCLSCRKPRLPYGMMADFVRQSSSSGRLIALCSVCEREVTRFTSNEKLEQLAEYLEISERPKEQTNGTLQFPLKS